MWLYPYMLTPGGCRRVYLDVQASWYRRAPQRLNISAKLDHTRYKCPAEGCPNQRRWVVRCSCSPIRRASVPSSTKDSLNHWCFNASLAVMRFFGSYTNIR